MNMPQRRLVTNRRYVPEDRIPEYAEAWTLLHNAAKARGAHAWAFASVEHRNVYIEFLEFGDESDVRADPVIAASIQNLQIKFNDPYPAPRAMENWVSLPTPPTLNGAEDE